MEIHSPSAREGTNESSLSFSFHQTPGSRRASHSPFPGKSATTSAFTVISRGDGDEGELQQSGRESEPEDGVAEVGASGNDEPEAPPDNAVLAYFKRLAGAWNPSPPWFEWDWDAFPAALFTVITLLVLAIIESFGLQPYNKGLTSFLPSFGASCCLCMCLMNAAGAQPRAMIVTHIVGAFLGVSWSHITKHLPSPLDQQIACAFAVAILTVLMMTTGTMQPSASATTCLAAFHLYGEMRDQGFMFMVAPATVGPCVIVFLGWVLNNLVPWRHCYPVWW